jgi:methyltransferase (TIGR00027 family)
MQDRRASLTALATAYMRAAHQVFDGEPRVLDDPLALTMLGPDANDRITQARDKHLSLPGRQLRAHVVLRSRYAEDRLKEAVHRGVRQYVLLGAGFDTFALRQPEWARELRILEVDHPATQALKHRLIDGAGLTVPDNVTFATIDFTRETLAEGLRRLGVSASEPAFFSWLGVTMYLDDAAIDATLAAIAAFPAGSEVVLTYASPSERGRSRLSERSAELGEPWLSYFEPEALDTRLKGAGFSTTVFLSAADAAARYFADRPQDLPVPAQTRIVSAIR